MINQKTYWWVLCVLLIPQFIMSFKKLTDLYINNTYTNYPALPLIAQEITKIRPIIGGELKVDVINDICSLAQGKITIQETTRKLLSEHKDINSIGNSSSPEALLINNNQASRVIICAAYMANLPFQKISPSKYNNLNGPDDKILADTLMTRIAILRANTDLYTLIAAKISNYKASSLDDYKRKIIEIFSAEAPFFLKNAERYYIENKNKNLTIYKFSDNDLEFSLSNWRYSIIDNSNLSLRNNEIMWFGGNNLLGYQYYVKVIN